MRRTLVRHCRTAWSGSRFCGWSDPPLSEAGRRDAITLADQLADASGPIITSPLARAAATARAIAGRTGRNVTSDLRLREVDFGDADGLTFDQIAATFPALAAALLLPLPELDWPNGERHLDFAARVDTFWGDCPDDAIVITHGGVLGHLLRSVVPARRALAERPGPGTLLRLEGPPWRIDSQWAPPAEAGA